MVYRWVGGKHACVNLTEVFPLMRLGTWGFTVEQTTLENISSKMIKYEKTCFDNQYGFIQFVLDTVDFLTQKNDRSFI